jgi:hypothetical protein
MSADSRAAFSDHSLLVSGGLKGDVVVLTKSSPSALISYSVMRKQASGVFDVYSDPFL